MNGSRTQIIVLSLAALALAQCAKSDNPPPEYPPLEPSQTAGLETTPDGSHERSRKSAPAIAVRAEKRTPIEGETPKLRITTPKLNATIRDKKVMVRLALTGWELSPTGNHVHLIVDNLPYIAIRDVSQPLELEALMQKELGESLSEGSHTLRAFPSRGHHESVKQGSPFAWTVFHLKTKTDLKDFDGKAPLLTYSRPKGCNPEGKPVLLDFYVTNVPSLSADGYKVAYTIDGKHTGVITEWAPHYIDNMGTGKHEIRLVLRDKDNAQVPGPFNDTTRSIEVSKSCP